MNILRRQKVSWDGGGEYGIGGFAELTELTAIGARKRILRRWAEDVVGQPIVPAGVAA